MNNKMKSWISSAFSDEFKPSKTNGTKSTSTNNKLVKATSSSFSKNEFEQVAELKNTISSSIQNINTKNKENSISTQGRSAKIAKIESISLSQRHEPESRADLVVNKAKIDQLDKIIDDILVKKKGSIVIVEGPSGCGKYVK